MCYVSNLEIDGCTTLPASCQTKDSTCLPRPTALYSSNPSCSRPCYAQRVRCTNRQHRLWLLKGSDLKRTAAKQTVRRHHEANVRVKINIKMKNFFILVIGISVLVAGCSQEAEVPPEGHTQITVDTGDNSSYGNFRTNWDRSSIHEHTRTDSNESSIN